VVARGCLVVSGGESGGTARVTPESASTYSRELAAVSHGIDVFRERAAAADGWWNLERASGLLAERARLTGDWSDWKLADELLDEAMRRAPDSAGPLLSRASLDFSLHRFDRVEPRLRLAEKRIVRDDVHRAAVLGLRADVERETGSPERALALARETLALHDTPTNRIRVAQGLAATGRPAESEVEYRVALAGLHGTRRHPRAWVHLMLGQLDLDRDRPADALAHFRDAERELAGWWLVEEHIAEATALLGDRDEAIARYERVLSRVDQPELMEALATLLAGRGEETHAADWRALADEVRVRRAELLPETAAAHEPGHSHGSGHP
jgi:hypothetical protein